MTDTDRIEAILQRAASDLEAAGIPPGRVHQCLIVAGLDRVMALTCTDCAHSSLDAAANLVQRARDCLPPVSGTHHAVH